MAVKCSVYIATSVDGYIAKPDGDIEWLHDPKYSEAKLNGLDYDDYISTVDVLVIGRNSYEKVRTFGFWPYENILVVVLTSRPINIPKNLEGKVRVESCSPRHLVSVLGEEGKRHLYIDGGVTIQGFLRDGLINEITITQIPILLGSGIPLFGEAGMEFSLRLVDTAASDNGFVQVRYEVTCGADSERPIVA